MRVLFVSSGNSENGINTIVKDQGESLIHCNPGTIVYYFTINGRGFWSYIKHIAFLNKYLKEVDIDIVHAHYSLSGMVAALAGSRPLLVSLMGSDTYALFPLNKFIKIFGFFFWNGTIVKSQSMKDSLGLKNCFTIPNGVNLETFKPLDKQIANKQIGYNDNKRLIVFLADPDRSEKNFSLAKEAVHSLERNDVLLIPVFNKPHKEIQYYLNAADVLLLTSKYEGSVNVVKEAMACNLPIVSTDVGDVKTNLDGVNHCYVCDSTPTSLAEGLKKALSFDSRTNGREKLISLGLDSDSIARRIIQVYEQVIKK